MSIDSLVGFSLLSCTFAKAYYSFEFCGHINGVYKEFHVGTQCNFSVNENYCDVREQFSSMVWDFIDKDLKYISVEEEHPIHPKVVFIFDDDTRFFIWWPRPLTDNLLIARERKTGEWFPIG